MSPGPTRLLSARKVAAVSPHAASRLLHAQRGAHHSGRIAEPQSSRVVKLGRHLELDAVQFEIAQRREGGQHVQVLRRQLHGAEEVQVPQPPQPL